MFDEDGNPIKFHAEFNHALFNGSVDALTGTFSGKLTVQAIDAVGNLTIKGEAVASTIAVSIDTKRTSGNDTEIFSLSWVSHQGDSGIAVVSLQFIASPQGARWIEITGGSGKGYFYLATAFIVYNNGLKIYNKPNINWFDLSLQGLVLMEFMIPVTQGINNIVLELSNGITIKNVLVKCDYIRKM